MKCTWLCFLLKRLYFMFAPTVGVGWFFFALFIDLSSYSMIHSLIDPLRHWSTHSLIHWPIYSFTFPPTYPFTLPHIHSRTHPLTPTYNRPKPDAWDIATCTENESADRSSRTVLRSVLILTQLTTTQNKPMIFHVTCTLTSLEIVTNCQSGLIPISWSILKMLVLSKPSNCHDA